MSRDNRMKNRMHSNWRRTSTLVSVALLIICSVVVVSCQFGSEKQNEVVIPRPVSYMSLQKTDPANQSLVAGSVAAWKTEPIGFDVNGRVDFVQEPGTIVHGSIFDKNRKVIEPGTLIARLQDKRYQIRVDQARADIQEVQAIHQRAKNT